MSDAVQTMNPRDAAVAGRGWHYALWAAQILHTQRLTQGIRRTGQDIVCMAAWKGRLNSFHFWRTKMPHSAPAPPLGAAVFLKAVARPLLQSPPSLAATALVLPWSPIVHQRLERLGISVSAAR
jgi:hypothetical protein